MRGYHDCRLRVYRGCVVITTGAWCHCPKYQGSISWPLLGWFLRQSLLTETRDDRIHRIFEWSWLPAIWYRWKLKHATSIGIIGNLIFWSVRLRLKSYWKRCYQFAILIIVFDMIFVIHVPHQSCGPVPADSEPATVPIPKCRVRRIISIQPPLSIFALS